MPNKTVSKNAEVGGLPDDLKVFVERMGAAGIRVRPSTAGAYALPELVEVPGKPLSEVIIEMRRGED